MTARRLGLALSCATALALPSAAGCSLDDQHAAPPASTARQPTPGSTTSSGPRSESPEPSDPQSVPVPTVTTSSPAPSAAAAGSWPRDALTPERVTDPAALVDRAYRSLGAVTSLRAVQRLLKTSAGTRVLAAEGRRDGQNVRVTNTDDNGTFSTILLPEQQYTVRDERANDALNDGSGAQPGDRNFTRPFRYYEVERKPVDVFAGLLRPSIPPTVRQLLRARQATIGQGYYPGRVPVIELMVTKQERQSPATYTYVVEARPPHRLRRASTQAAGVDVSTTYDRLDAVPPWRAPADFIPDNKPSEGPSL